MSFGKNPHVAKALAAELKVAEAPDEIARVQALRDAAHCWDRAAARESAGRKRSEYEANSIRNRTLADAEPGDPTPVDPLTLN